MTNTGPGDGEEMIRRVRTLAVGFADTGLTQAEELLRRVSPEGRAQARRERAARARRRNRLLARLTLAMLASSAVLVVLAQVVGTSIAVLAGAATMVLLTMMILSRASPRSPGREALIGADIGGLPAEATVWLAAQRRALPAPAVPLIDMLSRRLDDLAPQLVQLDRREPAADAVRKLIAGELPGLVEGWRGVPLSLRGVPQADGRSPNEHLVDGLRLIDA